MMKMRGQEQFVYLPRVQLTNHQTFIPGSTVTPEEDYDAFCLAYMFTYRDFEMGTLGLAWTGDLKNAGGVCEKNGVCRIFMFVN